MKLRTRHRLKGPPTTRCPPAIAEGIKTTAEVETFKRRRKQKPKKRINYVNVTQPNRMPSKRKLTAFYEQEAAREAKATPPAVMKPWTTASRRRLNANRPKKRERLKPKKKRQRL